MGNYKNLPELEPVMRGVREMTLPYYGNIKAIKDKEGDGFNFVTELDLKIEAYLKEYLAKVDSRAGFVGEESGGDRNQELFWLVDPIDGTGQFIRGLPFCSSMAALIDRGEVKIGAIYDFVNDNLYLAERGNGAFMNGKPIRVSDRPLKESYICWETHLDKSKNLDIFVKLRGRCFLFKAMVSGFEYAMVAAGKLDGRICFDPHGVDYDFAPGALLVAEAGGKVANIGSRDYNYRNLDFIAANPKIFEELTRGGDALFPIL